MILGCDVAFYEANSNGKIDFVKMKSNGIKFVIIRSGQNLWEDPKFSVNWYDAKQAGIPRGSYWFYDSRISPQVQAKLWINTIGNDSGELPLFADYEESYKGNYQGGQNFKIFLEEVKRLIPNKEIIIYTAFWYWRDNVSVSLHEYFSQYGLWIANYGVAKPSIPAPFKDWLFWQFSEDGIGKNYGCDGGLDMNYYNGTIEEFNLRFKIGNLDTIPITNEKQEVIETHEGISFYEIERYGTRVFVHVVDPKKARIFVTPKGNFGTVKNAVIKYNAQVGLNGGGWPQPSIPQRIANEVWVSDGTYLNTTVLDYRGFINISKEGIPEIHENNKNTFGLWNCWGFDRILVSNGVFNSKISDRTVKDARTGTGITADGKIVFISAEGNDYFQKGLSFPEMAKVLIEFGSIEAGNNDGGSSSQCINTSISKDALFKGSDGSDANVLNHILVFAKPYDLDVEPEPIIPPIGETNKMKYKVVIPVKARLTPSMYQVISKTVNAGTEFNSDMRQIITERIPLVGGVTYDITWLQMPDAYWIPMVYKGVEYVSESTVVEPPVVVDPTGEIITRKLEINTATGEVSIDGGAWE